jgi:hypothetical protein
MCQQTLNKIAMHSSYSMLCNSYLLQNCNALIILQCYAIATYCNETAGAMTQYIAKAKTKTTNILCLCSSIVCNKKQETRKKTWEMNINK